MPITRLLKLRKNIIPQPHLGWNVAYGCNKEENEKIKSCGILSLMFGLSLFSYILLMSCFLIMLFNFNLLLLLFIN